MRALSLLGVFVAAKLAVFAKYDLPFTWWLPIAFLWQDLLVVLVFAALDSIVRRAWFGWTLYGAMVLYVAVNLPLTLVLSSPLTWTMMRAARGTLGDSIRHHLTPENFAFMALIIFTGWGMPYAAKRLVNRADIRLWPARLLWILGIGASMVIVGLGRLSESRVDTAGLHRNCVYALVSSAFPRVTSRPATLDWRSNGFKTFSTASATNLTRFRAAAHGRNVVMIVLESTGARYLKPYGASDDPMPNLTALAQQSILFENAYSVYPESIKGLFSVLCSRYPAMDTNPEMYARVTTPAVAQELAEAGYRTALFHSGRFMYLGMEAIISRRGFQTLEDAGDIGGNHNSSFGVDEASTVRRLLAWIDAGPHDQPYFVTYLPIAGHHPYESPGPGPFPERDELGRYRNALRYGDAALGELMRGLKERGQFENTLWVVFGDHGEAFGQHTGNYGHTLFLWEENIRVPLLIAAPGLIREPLRWPHLASLIDVAPTVLDWIGRPAPNDYQGRSLLDGSHGMALFFTDYSLGLVGLRDGPRKFILELESGRTKLFDLEADPGERQNLSAKFPVHTAAYVADLLDWSAAQRHLITQPKSRTPDPDRSSGISTQRW